MNVLKNLIFLLDIWSYILKMFWPKPSIKSSTREKFCGEQIKGTSVQNEIITGLKTSTRKSKPKVLKEI